MGRVVALASLPARAKRRPCGLPDRKVTSIGELGLTATDVKQLVRRESFTSPALIWIA
jgi:hypothetical protein